VAAAEAPPTLVFFAFCTMNIFQSIKWLEQVLVQLLEQCILQH
jgi:hypothetical protein